MKQLNPFRLWSRIREEPRPFRFLASRLLWRSGLSHHFVVQRNGYRIRFHPSAVSAAVWTEPHSLSQEEAFVASRLRPGECYVDVGANVGLLALRAATVVGPTGRVIAIEAHPRTFGFLSDNVALNELSSVQAINRAVGDADGMLIFSDYTSDDQNHVMKQGSGMSVRAQRLDELIPEGPIALLKVDVEGFELPVFRGALHVLERTRAIVFESWDHHAARYGFTVQEVLALLRRSGFTLFRLVGSELKPMDGPGGSPCCENLVAIRE